MPEPTPARALSQALLALTRLADQARPQDLLAQAVQVLRALVPFDSAWWGQMSAGKGAAGPRNWLHGSVGLSQDFAQEWGALAAVDVFGLQSMARLGQVLRERDVIGLLPDPPEMQAFAERHGLHHCMALTVELPRSGLLFFVSVYRSAQRPEFSDADTVLFGEFVQHLVLHWQLRLQRLQQADTHRPWDGFALAAPTGQLLFAGLRISLALGAACPDWAGTHLPAELVQAFDRVPCSVKLGKACRLRLAPCGTLIALSLATGSHKPPLAPRELGVALLYAEGHAYKAIAAQLGLTPATVRTYLRTAYAELGVRNKLELVAALRAG